MKKLVWLGLIILAVIYLNFSLSKTLRYSHEQSLKEMSKEYKEGQIKIISACTEEIETRPSAELYVKRGNAYYVLSGFKELISENYSEKAISDYNKAIAIDPTNFGAHYNQALIFLNEKDYDQAISSFTKAIEIGPSDKDFNISFVYYMRARTCLENGDFDNAILDYTKTVELNPQNSSAYNERAQAYFSKKEYDKAWTDIHRVEELGYRADSNFIKALKKASCRQN